MSAALWLLCDATDNAGDGCGSRLLCPGGADVAAARAWAALQAWEHRGGRDLCPRHTGRARPRLRLDVDEPAPSAQPLRAAS